MMGVFPGREMTELNDLRRLSSVDPGETVWIRSITGEFDFTRRLMELGFVTGAGIDCLFRSANGDPTAYRVRGTVIALRKADVDGIWVESRLQEEG